MATSPRRTALGRRVLAGLLLVLALAGCTASFPRDPEGTLDRVSGGVLRVGVSESPPWTRVADDRSVTGSEAEIVEGYARSIGARIEWIPGAESQLIQGLEEDQVDLVIGGLSDDLPWDKQAAYTRGYAKSTAPDGSSRTMVFATRLGENAFLTSLERYLIAQGLTA